MPKRPLSAYMFYTQAIRKSLPQMSVTDQAKSLGASWKQLTESDKQACWTRLKCVNILFSYA